MTTGNDGQRQNRFRIDQLRVQFRGPQEARALSVFCPRRLQVLDTVSCGNCEHGLGMSLCTEQHVLVMGCGWRHAALQLPGAGEPSDSTLASLLTRPVDCVAQDAELESVLGVFLQGSIDAALVVDDNGQATGILSKSDLLRWYCARPQPDEVRATPNPILVERAAKPRVREAMSHHVYTLHAEADIARAAALMAYENVHQILVTRQDGRPIGLVSSLDILRCLARRNGYVMAESE